MVWLVILPCVNDLNLALQSWQPRNEDCGREENGDAESLRPGYNGLERTYVGPVNNRDD